MGLRTERGGDRLPDRLLAAAESLVRSLDPSQYSELYHLASNARQGIAGSPKEWKPFDGFLLDAGIDRSDRNHVTALILVLLPKVLQHENDARKAAIARAHERLTKQGVRAQWGRSGNFAASKESSGSIKKGAELFPLALDRLAKK